jgi:hypothetical protein|tara:strand:- start:222 stop:335 length:114 start_codon:yes stop_codon:yes gene_type:complete
MFYSKYILYYILHHKGTNHMIIFQDAPAEGGEETPAE